jgi:hypothetical protein
MLANIVCFKRAIYHRDIKALNLMMRSATDSISGVIKKWKPVGHHACVTSQVRSSLLKESCRLSITNWISIPFHIPVFVN